MSEFNPNNISQPNGNYFALPYSVDESKIVIVSVPWEVTTSYGKGTATAPDAIIDASSQIDLYDVTFGSLYTEGIGTYPIEEFIIEESNMLSREASRVIDHLELGGSINDEVISKKLIKVNKGSAKINDYVYSVSKDLFAKGKFVAIVGGDHSTPFGLIKAVSEVHKNFGVLHIDAHADLREAYEGFKYSHASIMYNVLNEVDGVGKLVQVAIRDFCEDEMTIINSDDRVVAYTDYHLHKDKFEGVSWKQICDKIVSNLPDKVYVSFDIDGLDPSMCPSTGTPVPGGLSYNEAVYLVESVVRSGRHIIGFDLNEVSPSKNEDDEWDANVGARLLYKLCNIVLSQNI